LGFCCYSIALAVIQAVKKVGYVAHAVYSTVYLNLLSVFNDEKSRKIR
jgi:hypothetical protein